MAPPTSTPAPPSPSRCRAPTPTPTSPWSTPPAAFPDQSGLYDYIRKTPSHTKGKLTENGNAVDALKGAAKVVISDDDFATLVAAVEQGRVVHGNLKKVVLYLFATSVDEVLLLLLALLAGLPPPLAAVQILWINVVTEGTVTVNLVMEPPDGDEMRRAPTPREAPLIDAPMLRRLALMVPAAVAVCFGWFAARLAAGVDLDAVRTETFTLLAMCQWLNVLNCESATRSVLRLGVLRNRWLVGGLAAAVALQAAVLYVPALAALFHTTPLDAGTLLALLAAASPVLWVEEIRKAFSRRRALRAAA
jgi:magnesium-transporting ATPase (P-type)